MEHRRPSGEGRWGYAKRFGIIHVDYDTQKRTSEPSFLEVGKRSAVEMEFCQTSHLQMLIPNCYP